MSDVVVSFALKVGSDLVREDDLPESNEIESLGDPEGIFGALIVEIGGEEILDEQFWDKLDVALERLIEATDEASDDTEGVVEMPGTRFEIILRRPTEDEIEIELQDDVVSCDFDEFRAAVVECAERLVQLVEASDVDESAQIERLREMVSG